MEHPIARVLPLLSPAHLDRDFDYLVPPDLDAIAQPGVRVRVRFAGRLIDGYLLERRTHSDHGGKLVKLERVVSGERVLTPEIAKLATIVAARYAGTRADVLRLAIPPRHARTETGGSKKKAGDSDAEEEDSTTSPSDTANSVGEDPRASSVAKAPRRVKPADIELDSTRAPEVGPAERPRDLPESPDTDAPTWSAQSAGPASVGADSPASEADSVETAIAEGSVGDRSGPPVVSGVGTAAELTVEMSPPTPGPAGGDADLLDSARADGAAEKWSGPLGPPGAVSDAGTARADSAVGEVVSVDAASVDGRPGVGAGLSGPSGVGGAGTAASVVVPLRVDATGSDPALAEGDSVGTGSQVLAHSGEEPLVSFDLAPWGRYLHGAAFMTALAAGKGPRAAWQALPGEDWPRRLAELAAAVVAQGRSAILMVPDQRDLDRVLAECDRLVGDSAVGLSAGLGPAARYRRWLAVLRGTARVVVGTRSAVFAPAKDLGLMAIWDDGDDTYAEPRAPYPHAREVAMLRSHETGAAFVAAGFARTAEIQAVVESGWAHDLVADRAVVRAASPRISAPGDSDAALERDPIARAVRIPETAFRAARSALKEGAGVLVQVPRRGYIPSLACTKCRTPARCRRCNGPLALPDGRARHQESQDAAHSPSCRWCGITEAAFRCPSCGSRALRAVVIGAIRTAEELGRAFPGVPIRGSGGGAMLDTVPPGPQVVVATVGAEPVLPGGYGVALLLDSWALLGRADLRAAEDALRRWMTAATLVRTHGQVIVMAEPTIPTVQALLRWDPVWHASAELAARTEVGFPPAVRLAAIDGTTDSIAELLSATTLPDAVDVLGPVPLPVGARKPFSSGDSPAEVERMLLRVDRKSGNALARALTTSQAIRSTHRSDAPLRVQIDPVDIG
ncbi:primosomal protein N' [Nocardia sp. NPDC049149]|uniref:primosomal protein N' family DNA-binding protein n=1 Tax=Nocardia sp. NPDC049149 TaxID=3364315 RepID=UPI003723D8B9